MSHRAIVHRRAGDLFNRFNYEEYETNELNIRFLEPIESNNIAYRPRVLQFGFWLAF